MAVNTHYYTNDPQSVCSNPQTFKIKLLDKDFTFNTDNGVFSKHYLDFGSQTLINSFVPNDLNYPILDMGCGYGPIGISLSKKYQKEALLVDINQRAIELCNKNIKLNKSDLAKAQNSYLFDSISTDLKFSSIVTNPPIRAGKDVVFAIYDNSFNYLAENGELWVVIQKKQGAPSSMKHLETLFGNCEVVCKNKGYYILKSIKKVLTI